jgi:hypothetical protein
MDPLHRGMLDRIAALAGALRQNERQEEAQQVRRARLASHQWVRKTHSEKKKSEITTSADKNSDNMTSTNARGLKRNASTSLSASSVRQNLIAPVRPVKSARRIGYCAAYTLHGTCPRGDNNCTRVHDPNKVAICHAYVRGNGTCPRGDSCPLQHKIDPARMPVCRHYLRGACHNDNCPYAHVKVAADAAVCKPFLRGYCPAGLQCRYRHLTLQQYRAEQAHAKTDARAKRQAQEEKLRQRKHKVKSTKSKVFESSQRVGVKKVATVVVLNPSATTAVSYPWMKKRKASAMASGVQVTLPRFELMKNPDSSVDDMKETTDVIEKTTRSQLDSGSGSGSGSDTGSDSDSNWDGQLRELSVHDLEWLECEDDSAATAYDSQKVTSAPS